MCGISGIISVNRDVAKAGVLEMNHALAHRGPDDEGMVLIEFGPRVIGLGHRRLAIIDLSSAGHQPMQDPERQNWITYNGEIYNFQELRRELEDYGEIFRTATDTEVILKAYGVWGTDCLKRLNGIFAFGIWDAQRHMLILARDPLGVKPLYYYSSKDFFIFASEVRALLSTGFVAPRLDFEGLHSYLAYGSVQEPFTLIHNIQSLLPGHFLECKIGGYNNIFTIDRYWRLPMSEDMTLMNKDELIHELKDHLAKVVQSQMISDVPLGAFLSGGIDSTSIAALMKVARKGPVRTFSLVFEEKRYDERRWSRLVAQTIGTEHSECLLTGEAARNQLERALLSYDQPSIDGLNTWFVAKAARDSGLTVSLSGVGGDEIFGGYDGFKKSLLAERIKWICKLIPHFFGQPLAYLLNLFGPNEYFRKTGQLLLTKQHPYFLTRRLFSDFQIKKLLLPDIKLEDNWLTTAFKAIESETMNYDPINRASAFELQTYMRSTLLRDTDQMSMAHALEVRVPLIDSELVDFLFRVPGTMKLDIKQPKPLLTLPLEDIIPRECVYRPKQGFEFPFQEWFKTILEEQVKDIFLKGNSGTVSLLFSKIGLQKLWNAFKNNRVNWSRIWSIFVLDKWVVHNKITI